MGGRSDPPSTRDDCQRTRPSMSRRGIWSDVMSLTWRAKWGEVGYFLKGFRTWLGEQLDDVDERYQGIVLERPEGPEVTELNGAFKKVRAANSLDFLRKLEDDPFNFELTRASVR